MHDSSTTLVAIATPPGRGGVGCLRISGPDALLIAERLFRASGRTREAPRPGARPSFGHFLDRHGRPLDHGYLVVFGPGNSYTGELTVEAWTHGSPAVLAELVESTLAHGAVHAEPGEFTYRALQSGRLDLARAEAVRDLVHSRTLYQARLALQQAEGSISRQLAPLREALEECIARGEAAVEFVDESEVHMPEGQLLRAIDDAVVTCDRLLAGFRTGRVVRDGATLAVVGRPNVGKSSLFNRLLSRDRAIVADVAGTTRDTLEEELDLGGIPLRLIDTAGLRDVSDAIESEGVRRAEAARADADLVLMVLDGSRALAPAESEALRAAQGEGERERTVVAVNKSDLPAAFDIGAPPFGAGAGPTALRVSARTGAGIEAAGANGGGGGLLQELRARLVGAPQTDDPLITNSRHAAAVRKALGALEQAAAAARAGWSEELVLEDLRAAIGALGTITGEFTTEDLYDKIFSTFCIGK